MRAEPPIGLAESVGTGPNDASSLAQPPPRFVRSFRKDQTGGPLRFAPPEKRAEEATANFKSRVFVFYEVFPKFVEVGRLTADQSDGIKGAIRDGQLLFRALYRDQETRRRSILTWKDPESRQPAEDVAVRGLEEMLKARAQEILTPDQLKLLETSPWKMLVEGDIGVLRPYDIDEDEILGISRAADDATLKAELVDFVNRSFPGNSADARLMRKRILEQFF
jgi:hypothetical protein